MPSIPPELCARCKGYKLLCGLPRCPILERFRVQVNAVQRINGKDVVGSTPPSVLVGEYGYPKVSFYYMVPPGKSSDEAAYYDAPKLWAERRETLGNIVKLRGEMVSAYVRLDVNEPWRLYETELGLASLSERPVESDVLLKSLPLPQLKFDGMTKPMGPRAPAEKVIVSGAPKLQRKAEEAIWDDAKAEDIIWELYQAGVDVYKIQDMLSLGFLGRLRARKLVPTRWAITAVDDIISRRLRREVRDFRSVDSVEAREAEYLGNRFLVILMPGEGTFEWIEVWHPRGLWTQQAERPIVERVEEDPLGRASAMDGGFSAARLAVLEGLRSSAKKADVVILREILPTYYAPVGNWHIRETVRRAMSSESKVFDSVQAAAEYAASWLRASPQDVLAQSSLLGFRARQRRLTDFLR
ncbi:hypothetical protein ASAC_0318 [Acidilobus saccharovorans 345-15]|uniref:DNA repair protein n=1 Tax=Acidilobus saccharovorans (strain DSM 16705 / JCM 18335 / VKM B-2471 / 345-15) TaxID=666510 RepID=D9Q087_ACIS3|nr:Nre family DNA repair protein [Acidilobus saccharovorans]ADL18725.1 hypothetical protein ASAC_0318 [Acidilobus saccharovorans 345-15]